MSKPKLLIMAGGTGGHVYPAIAIAKEMQQQGWDINWLGTADRMEADLVPKHGFNIEFLDISGIRGNGIFRKIKAPLQILKAIYQAYKIIKKYNPNLVIGMGGFASGPGGIAAKLLRKPLIIHEQNAVAGMTNKILAKFATKIFSAFPNAFPENIQATTVGNPIRQDILNLATEKRDYSNDNFNILVVGGSLGAKSLNEIIPKAIKELNFNVKVVHQTGKNKLEETNQLYKKLKLDNVETIEFIDDIVDQYKWCDIVICRSGALTVSEIGVLGIPAIFIPYPYAVDNHQEKNAQFLVRNKGAYMLDERNLKVENLEYLINKLNSLQQRKTMAKHLTSVSISDATQNIAKICNNLIRE